MLRGGRDAKRRNQYCEEEVMLRGGSVAKRWK